MTINKAIVIVLAVIALGLFTVAGSVIYATQQIPQTPQKTQFENEILLDCSEKGNKSALGDYRNSAGFDQEMTNGKADDPYRKIVCLKLLDVYAKRYVRPR